MPETVQQYTERILSNVNTDPLAIQATTAERLERLVGNLPAETLRRHPLAERWSVAEILAHLADAEIVAAFRIRKILSEPGCAIAAFDQDAWASSLDYAESDPQQSLRTFRTLRAANLALLRSLTAEQWERYGIHSERGKETLRRVVTMYAGHDVNHVRQIEGILSEEAGARKPAA